MCLHDGNGKATHHVVKSHDAIWHRRRRACFSYTCFRGLLISVAALLLTLGLVACSSVPETDFRDRMRLSQALFGDTHEFFYIPSQGSLSDRLFVQQSQRHPDQPSVDARRLVDRLTLGKEKLLRMAVSSPSSSKAQSILLEACHLLKGSHLPHLTLAFIGNPRHSPKIEQCFSLLQASYVLAPYPADLHTLN